MAQLRVGRRQVGDSERRKACQWQLPGSRLEPHSAEIAKAGRTFLQTSEPNSSRKCEMKIRGESGVAKMANKITDIAAWTTVEKLKKVMEDISEQENMPDTSQLKRQVDFLAERLLRVDVDLAPTPILNDLNSHLTTVHTQMTALASDKNRQHIKQATPSLSTAFQQLMCLPLLGTAEQMEQSFSDVLLDAKQAADISTQSVSTKAKELENIIGKLQEQATGLAAEVQASKARTDSLIAEYQKQFSETESTRTKRFEARLEEVNNDVEELKGRLDSEAAAAREDLATKSEEILELLRRRDRETAALARAMGARGISATFQATANKNQWAADMLRVLAIILLIGMVAIIIVSLWNLPSASLETTLVRFLAAMLISIPATYLARESSHQRAEAVRSRRIEVELAALGPFIEPLDGPEKAELRKKLVETYFGRAFDKDDSDHDSITLGGNLLDFVKAGKDWFKR